MRKQRTPKVAETTQAQIDERLAQIDLDKALQGVDLDKVSRIDLDKITDFNV